MNMQITPQTETGSDKARHLRTALIGGGALVLVLGGFWFLTHGGEERPRRVSAAVPVKVAAAEQRDMPVIERTIGTVLANSTVQVNARVQGQLLKANFKEGQLVKAGDLLFQIDPAPYQAAYDNAMATLASTKAKADRYGALKAQNAIAGQEYDDAQAAYLQAKANAEAAQINLNYTRIRAPVSGKTGPILVQPGNMVTTNNTTTPLVTLNEIQPVKISFALPQSDLPRIQAMARTGGLKAVIALHDAGGQDLEAPVDFISNAVAGTSGTIELRATFANADSALVPGQLVDVTVALSQIPGAVVIPREGINNGPEGQFVYLVNDGTALEVPVKVLFDDSVNDAIEGNVKAGDRVIVDGQLRVTPGAKVTVSRGRGAGAAGGPRAGGPNSGGKGRRGRRPAAAN
jgi:multidrug efflux system membrane fusion protein